MYLATALRESFKEGYKLANLKKDFIAGMVVSLVALPLSMALSIAVGLPPEHGIYTAIIAGTIVALLGGSRTQVTGPTAAFVVVLAPIVAEFGLRGIIWCQILAGIMLLMMGISKLGRYINFMPYPVTTGFTAGIALVIFTLSLNDFLGLGIAKMEGSFLYKASQILDALPSLNYAEAGVGFVTLLLIVGLERRIRFLPSPLIGIVGGSLLGYYLNQNGLHVETIMMRFKGGIPSDMPQFHFPGSDSALFALPTTSEISTYLGSAFVIAVLAGLESLLSATVADGMKGTKHNPNAELNALGIGNIFSGLFAGIPATGAIARTSANIQNGANSPFAAVIHALFILLFVVALTPWINQIPMASLAALLVVVAYRMSHYKQFYRIIKIAPKTDIVVLVICFSLTVLVDMVAGVTAGIVLAALLLVKNVTDATNIELTSGKDNDDEVKLPRGTMVYNIDGPLFFGTVEKALDRYNFIKAGKVKKLIIDIRDVPFVDMTGLVAFKSMILSLTKNKIEVAICGKGEVINQIKRKLKGRKIDNLSFINSIADVVAKA
jgi:SulP family sulfate permease